MGCNIIARLTAGKKYQQGKPIGRNCAIACVILCDLLLFSRLMAWIIDWDYQLLEHERGHLIKQICRAFLTSYYIVKAVTKIDF